MGQGDSALFVLPDGFTILIDGGDEGLGDGRVIPALQDRGVARLDLLVLSHPHADHCGGLDEVLSKVPVDEIWENGEGMNTGPWDDYAQARDASGAEVTVPQAGFELVVGDVLIEVLSANGGYEGQNNDSLVIMLTYGDVKILTTGDIEAEAQGELLSKYGSGLEAHVVKVPHHGSWNQQPSFAPYTSPEIAVISCGAGNEYGHPHQESIDSYQATGAAVCRTDFLGNISVTTDGETLESNCL